MRVVVTGGAGFIGAQVTAALAAAPDIDEVVVLDDLSSGDLANLDGLDVPIVLGSVLDDRVLARAMRRADAVVHLAAIPSVPRSLLDPIASHQVIATGTLHVLEAARHAGDPYVVVASSSSVYGASLELPKRETMRAAPLSPYAAAKLAAESYALAYASCFDLETLALRFFNVFGPLQSTTHAYAAVVPAFLEAALAGRPLMVHGDGRQTRDFTYVGSVVAVICDAVRRRVTSELPVNVAFGTRTSLLELIAELEVVLGHPLARQHVDSRVGDVPDSQADPTRLRELFPGVAPVAIREGLRVTADWVASQASNAGLSIRAAAGRPMRAAD
ncbi:MAG: NAD-dependent epimerase/dehydratase family protein [Actinomycetota bacterium]